MIRRERDWADSRILKKRVPLDYAVFHEVAGITCF